jgi:16S rRNA (guanine527-N7)-methyltransferase
MKEQKLFTDLLTQGLDQIGFSMTLSQKKTLIAYVNDLWLWNHKHSFTALRDKQAMICRHVLDAFTLLAFIRPSDKNILDVGTGFGVPGLPLAVMYPEKSVTLIDGHGKKMFFVKAVQAALTLSNVSIIRARVERFRPYQPYSLLVSRAVCDLKTLWKITAHLRAAKARFLVMKGLHPEEEIQALPKSVNVNVHQVMDMTGENKARCIVELSDARFV